VDPLIIIISIEALNSVMSGLIFAVIKVPLVTISTFAIPVAFSSNLSKQIN
jgi:hypothetical protein